MADASPLPGSITFDATKGAEAVAVFESAPMATGIFQVKVIATDPHTAVKTNLVFTVTIKCTQSIKMMSSSLTPLIYNVGTEVLTPVDLPIPVYSPIPTDCPYDPFTYELIYTDNPVATFPSFINQYPTTAITVATQDRALLGVYNFRLVATEPSTGL